MVTFYVKNLWFYPHLLLTSYFILKVVTHPYVTSCFALPFCNYLHVFHLCLTVCPIFVCPIISYLLMYLNPCAPCVHGHVFLYVLFKRMDHCYIPVWEDHRQKITELKRQDYVFCGWNNRVCGSNRKKITTGTI